MSRTRVLLAGAVVAAGATPLAAASYTFNGTVDGRIGIGNNPGLNSVEEGTSALVGANINGVLTRATTLGTTTLVGNVDLEQNFNRYGFLDNYTVNLAHTQRLSERLTVNGTAGYQNTINRRGDLGAASGFYAPTVVGLTPVPTTTTTATPTATNPATVATLPGAPLTYDPSAVDFASFGQRNQRVFGSAGLAWTPGARDTVTAGADASHSTYGGSGIASTYTEYGANTGYLRTLNANTRLGLQGSVQHIKSGQYSDSTSYQAGIQFEQRLSANWLLNGTLGLLFQHQSAYRDTLLLPGETVGRRNNRTVAFSASLCGTYPRTNGCLTASRQSAPSGIGGLRTSTDLGASVGHSFTEHSRGNLFLSYDHSGSSDRLTPRQDLYSARASYSRDVARRIALGANAGYQRREFGAYRGLVNVPAFGQTNLNSYQLTADVIYRFGRLR